MRGLPSRSSTTITNGEPDWCASWTEDGIEVDDFDRLAWQIEEVTDSRLAVVREAGAMRLRKAISVAWRTRSGSLALSVGGRGFEPAVARSSSSGTSTCSAAAAIRPLITARATQEWRHDSAGSVEAGADLSFGNTYEGVDIALAANPPAPAEWFAVETVSNSDSGYERVYQGSCLDPALAAGA